MGNTQKICRILLTDIPRVLGFPYTLREIGFLQKVQDKERFITNKLEFAIRLSSISRYAIDVINGKEYSTEFPNVILKIPGVSHRYSATDQRDAIFFSYNPELAEHMRDANLFQEPFVWKINLSIKIKSLVTEAKELMKRTFEYGVADRLDLLAFQLYEELLLNRWEYQETRDIFVETKIHKIASYLKINFSHDIDFNSLCRENGLSPRSFFRHWKRFFDKTPARFVQELKMIEASRLLLESKKQIGSIANELNYRDIAFFCEVYRKRFGMTPLQYRKLYGKH